MKLKSFYGRLNLRRKILTALLSLALVPLIITLVVLSTMVERQMTHEIEKRGNQVMVYVKKSIEVSTREISSFVTFFSRNTDLVNAVYYAALTGDSEQIKRISDDAIKESQADLLVILDKSGKPIFEGRGSAGAGDVNTTFLDIPAVKAALAGTMTEGIGLFGDQLVLLSAAPIRLQQEQIGLAIAAIYLNDAFASPLQKESGAEVAFYHDKKLVGTSNQDFKKADLTSIIAEKGGELELGGADHLLFAGDLGSNAGIILGLNNAESNTARLRFRIAVLVLLVGAGVLAFVVGSSISHDIIKPLLLVNTTLKEMAEGEGDLTRTIEVSSNDEVGELATSFNSFTARLRDMVRRTRDVSVDLNAATDRIRNSSSQVNAGTQQQAQSLAESYLAVQAIEGSISGIAESTGSLVEAAEESSSATLELGATIEEIAHQMEKLFATVEDVSSSISEMSVSSQQIAENVEILSSSTEVTASSITELDASIKEIEENAEKTSRLSEEAAVDAQKGKETVDETIQGILAIRESVDRASAVIQDLGNQSNAIGKILTVIDEVADQTSLLSLNAAIIAAQAGEHGKGFAVVADEIRELAERTAVSTREISAIITNLQNGTSDAVRAMAAGSERVHQEVERSKSAGQALDKIRSSTMKAREQVSGIVRATQEQSRGSRQITNSINQVASMLDQIASAIKQQSEGTRQLARASEAMKEIAAQGKLSTGEQAKGSRQINLSMERIRSMIERIDEATREQSERTRQVVEAVSSIREVSESTTLRTSELDQVVEILSRQTTALEGEVGAFKV
jgi:methyl-accepting chemotaxis protein